VSDREPVPEPVAEADLRACLVARGIALRDEEFAPVLATARFLQRAAALVRAAG
jgi:hypothetical protein